MVSWTRSKQLIFLPADRGRQVWGSVSSFRGEQRENICWVWCFRLVNYRAAGLATSGGLCKSGKLVILATCFFSSRISTSSGATDMTAADNSGRGRWRAGLHIATWFEMIFYFVEHLSTYTVHTGSLWWRLYPLRLKKKNKKKNSGWFWLKMVFKKCH